MNSFTAIWERALIILENEMTKNDNFNLFVTWIKELKPEFELNGSYYFEVATEIHKDIIQFATSEQLTAHANSIAVRFEDEDKKEEP